MSRLQIIWSSNLWFELFKGALGLRFGPIWARIESNLVSLGSYFLNVQLDCKFAELRVQMVSDLILEAFNLNLHRDSCLINIYFDGIYIHIYKLRKSPGNTGIHNMNRMRHDASSLHAPEYINHRTHRPLHNPCRSAC
ncbi:hypothetical protein IEQ34_006999 [Dendrobium chrysotoxum]|uniref:Uncharacterized protein n=1 Tax=Dendrobium chrysotoxum TaxID=161865 RepID=A0AAV7H9I7_DENCH|nr:hypothetical protein IEQ34_006999 [Dendrobium chrysotoxum]